MKKKKILNKISIIAVSIAFLLFIGHTFLKEYFGAFMIPSIYLQIASLVVFGLSEFLKFIYRKES